MRSTVLLAAIALLALAAALKLQLSYDLAFFMPPANTPAQQLLLERVGQGPGAQLTFLVLPNGSQTQTQAQAEAAALAEAVRLLPQVQRVLPEATAPNIEQIPALIWQHRLLLADLPSNQQDWFDALNTTLDDMMFASDVQERALLGADPTLASLNALEKFSQLASQQQFSSETQQTLLIQASAAAFDLDAQTRLVDSLRAVLAERGANDAQLYGSGVYGVDLQRSVQREATLYSLLASAALLVLLFWYLRSPKLVLVTALPLLAGAVAGLTALAYVFDQVHGITLAFGFTLLGVAVDYPLHLVVQQQTLKSNAVSIWPTLRLGVLSTAIAYLAFAMGGTQGLQQLGLFALVGIAVAALTSAWLCPSQQATAPSNASMQMHNTKLRQWPWMLVLIISAPLLLKSQLFSDDLGSLTPVPAETLAADAKLRQSLGVSDMRYLIALRGNNSEQLLQQTEELSSLLQRAIHQEQLHAYQSITSLLPSQRTQTARMALLADSETIESFDSALAQLPFANDAFTAFREAILSQDGAGLTWENLEQDPALGAPTRSMMYPTQADWVSLVFLAGIQQPAQLQQMVEEFGAGQWVDLKAASFTLAADYRERVLQLLGIALAGIALLLLSFTRQPQRVIWLLGTLAASVASAMLGSLWLQGLLSLFDLMALTLVAGLGLDYALFYSKPNNLDELEATKRAVLLCALSSLLVFGILACSSIPLLKGIGTTVAFGVITAYLLARFGRYAKSPS